MRLKILCGILSLSSPVPLGQDFLVYILLVLFLFFLYRHRRWGLSLLLNDKPTYFNGAKTLNCVSERKIDSDRKWERGKKVE